MEKKIVWWKELNLLVDSYAREYKNSAKNNTTDENRLDRYYKKIYDFVKALKDQPLERIPEETKEDTKAILRKAFMEYATNGEDTKSQSGEREWKEKLEYFMQYDEGGLYDEAVTYFEELLSESKKECIQKALDDFGGWFNEPGEEKEDYKGFRKHMESKYKLV